MPKLYSVNTHKGDGEYIGRGTPLGNPFIMGIDGDRDEVCNLFEQYALWRLSVQSNWLDKLEGKDLYCHCTPSRCHGDALLKLLNKGRLKTNKSTKKLSRSSNQLGPSQLGGIK